MKIWKGWQWVGLVSAFLLLAGSANPLQAQVLKAQVLGTITDTTGAVVPNVRVTLTEITTNVRRTTESNESGNYVFVNLDPGVYHVEAEVGGFNKAVRRDVDVRPNSTVRVNFELAPGTVSEVVEVSAEAVPLLQTDRSDTGGKLEQRQLQAKIGRAHV